jgi:hypothetical protein
VPDSIVSFEKRNKLGAGILVIQSKDFRIPV